MNHKRLESIFCPPQFLPRWKNIEEKQEESKHFNGKREHASLLYNTEHNSDFLGKTKNFKNPFCFIKKEKSPNELSFL